MAVDEGVGEAAPVVGLRMVSTMRICGHGLVSWQSGPGRVENGMGEATPVGLTMVSAKRLQ